MQMKKDQIVIVDSRGEMESDQNIFDLHGNLKAGSLRRAMDTLIKYAKILEEENVKNNTDMDSGLDGESNQNTLTTNNNS